jgi:hypothetical protein
MEGRLFVSIRLNKGEELFHYIEWIAKFINSEEKQGNFLRHLRYNDCRNHPTSTPELVLEFYPEGYKN